MKFWHFAVATFLTLPKQIFIVYLGVLLVAQDQNNTIENVVLGITFAITIVMGVYVWFKLKKIKVILLEEQAQKLASVQMSRLQSSENGSSLDVPSQAPSNWQAPSEWRRDEPDRIQEAPAWGATRLPGQLPSSNPNKRQEGASWL